MMNCYALIWKQSINESLKSKQIGTLYPTTQMNYGLYVPYFKIKASQVFI